MSDQPLSGLPPILPKAMRLLVLGSLPGHQSLNQQKYYAHPRNAFWNIMATLFGWPSDLPYKTRVVLLGEQGVGLWDVIDRARRVGSLDSAIDNDGLETNALAQLICQEPDLATICLNGQKAYQLFCKRVVPQIPPSRMATLSLVALPSTSPAHAAMSFADKCEQWQVVAAALRA